MAEIEVRGFCDVMKDVISIVAPGLENFGAQIGAELGRMGTQGAAELASALFSDGDAYVAYGRGQLPPEIETGQEQAVQAVEAPQVERGGMEM